MKHYGVAPPWTSKRSRYGWWKNVGELWEGGWAWELQSPLTTSESLQLAFKELYAPAVASMLNSNVFIEAIAGSPLPTGAGQQLLKAA